MAIERWKPVMEVGEGKRFAVSSRGNVKDVVSGRMLHPVCTTAGFLMIRMRYEGRRHGVALHRLVALAFLPGKPTYPVIFKDGNKSRCMASNLRWAKVSDIRRPYRKLTDEEVIWIREQGRSIPQDELARELGVCRHTVSDVARGATYIGPQWMPKVVA
jgi:hypothetical protein